VKEEALQTTLKYNSTPGEDATKSLPLAILTFITMWDLFPKAPPCSPDWDPMEKSLILARCFKHVAI